MLIRCFNPSIVTVTIIYFLPDYSGLVSEFIWQTLDEKPRYPRVHRFLDFWHHEIDAVIKEVTICDSDYRDHHFR